MIRVPWHLEAFLNRRIGRRENLRLVGARRPHRAWVLYLLAGVALAVIVMIVSTTAHWPVWIRFLGVALTLGAALLAVPAAITSTSDLVASVRTRFPAKSLDIRLRRESDRYSDGPDWSSTQPFTCDESILDLTPPSLCRDWGTWEHRGFDAMHTQWELILRGLGAEETLIESLWVVVESYEPLETGFIALCPTGGVAGTRRRAVAHLSPSGDKVRCDFNEDGVAFPERYYRLRKGEYEIIEVLLTGDPGFYRFHLELNLLSGGQEEVVVMSYPDFSLAVPARGEAFTWSGEAKWTRSSIKRAFPRG